jgi:large subunit ribosomal protein L5
MAKTTTQTGISTIRFKDLYVNTYRSELLKELGLTNVNTVPMLEKIVVNIGTGKTKDDKKAIDAAINTIRKVTGQQPIKTIAKKSIAAFKLRKGSEVGLKVTLRGDRMYEFMERLISLVLPRLRDFHGVPDGSFDKQGNYSIGLKDQSVFPELSFEETTTIHGLQVVFVIKNSQSIDQSRALLTKFGMPFETRKESK